MNEKKLVRKNVENLISLSGEKKKGFNVLISCKEIDDLSNQLLSDNGIYVFSNINQQHFNVLVKSMGVNVINSFKQLEELSKRITMVTDDDDGNVDNPNILEFQNKYIGRAKEIEFTKIPLTGMFEARITGIKATIQPMAFIEITSNTSHQLHQNVGAFVTGMGVGKCCLEDLFVLPGAFLPEFTIIDHLKREASNIDLDPIDKEIFFILTKSIETIPSTFLRNHSLLELQVLNSYNSDCLLKKLGINISDENYFCNPKENGIFDTYRSKIQVYRFAIDIVCLLLKIDKIIQPTFNPQPSIQPTTTNNNHQNKEDKERRYLEFKPPPIQIDSLDIEKREEDHEEVATTSSHEDVHNLNTINLSFVTVNFELCLMIGNHQLLKYFELANEINPLSQGNSKRRFYQGRSIVDFQQCEELQQWGLYVLAAL
eukprot:gene5267-6558_t